MANVIKHKRGSGSDPGASDLVVGEVAIRTDVGKLFTKMDNGSVAEIAGGGSDIAINTLSSSSATGGGSATFNGSAYRFTLSAPPSVSAQQLLVSINGVIQKPVAGTGQPSEGFSVSGTDIILGDAPATGADFFILTFKSLGVSEPADNSVTSAKIVDGAIVNADINASAAIAGSKIDPTFTSAISTSANEITISGGTPKLNLTDTGNNPDYVVANNDGQFRIRDATNSANRLTISSDGTVDINGNLDVAAGIDVTGAITGTAGLSIDGATVFNEAGADVDFRIEGVNEANLFHVDAGNRRIGIITSSPSDELHIKESKNGDVAAQIENTNTGSSARARLQLSSDSASLQLYATGAAYSGVSSWSDAGVITTGSGASGGLILNTTASGGTIKFQIQQSEKVRIDNSGRVGIGTTSPQSPLTVAGNGDTAIDIVADLDNNGANNWPIINFRRNSVSGTPAARIYQNENDNALVIDNNGSERMRIDSSGNVAIGNTNAQQLLHVWPDTANTTSAFIRVTSGDRNSNTGIDLGSDADGDGRLNLVSNGNLKLYTNNTERMRIDGSGNLGIGTTSMTGKLNVQGSAGGVALETTDATNSTFRISHPSAAVTLLSGGSSQHLALGTGFAEKMRIDSSGNSHFGSSGTLNDANTVSIVPADGRISFGMDGRSSFVTSENGAYIYSGDGISGTTIAGDLILQSRSNQDRTIRFVTGASPAQRVSITNNGLLFGTDTAAANALDDYEEGTFTPRLGGTSNSSTYYVDGTGTYIKIGRQVTVTIRFSNVNLNDTAAGQAIIFNLPFAGGHAPTNGPSGNTSNVSYYNVAQGGNNEHTWYVSNGTSRWAGLVSRHNTSWVDFPVSDFHSSSVYMNFSGTYFTA